jgi:hypothetical protein
MKKSYTVNEIVTIAETLKRMSNVGLTGKAAYLVYRNLSRIAKVADDFEKTRNDLIMKWGEKSDNAEGQTVVKRNSENYPKFVEEITEILTQPEEVDLYMIAEDDLEKFIDADLSVADFAVIDMYLVDHPEEAKKEEPVDVEETPAGKDAAPTEG